ncbi:MAG: hypothetical protein LBB53_01765 [Prevotellaceae bacterium]|jgi:hypothetical protein|nr:hypothetical protein [Prevotellaceae bacterium]
MNIRILIPVYKKTLLPEEAHSLKQCFTILNDYLINIVTYKELNIDAYLSIAGEMDVSIEFEYFDKSYFKNVESYSRMLESREFYLRFKGDDYILIYQIDAFVFKDELIDWCAKGFDYIGAPWFAQYGLHENGNALYKVGNGGVSLRKVNAFLERFDKKMPLSIFPFYVKQIRKRKLCRMCIKTLKLGILLLFTHKTVEYCIEHLTDELIPEDCFWTDGLSYTKLAFKVPDVVTAAQFCFEKSPSYLYRLTGEKLPFACHAYTKYEYETFWKKHISNVE